MIHSAIAMSRSDAESFDILSLWQQHRDATALAAAVNERFARTVDEAAVRALADFLLRSELAVDPAKSDWRTAWQRRESGRQHWLLHAVHAYLFFRIPLFSPERILANTLPLVRPFLRRATLAGFAVLGLIGLYLVSRQWEAFFGTFQHVFTPAGAVTLALVMFTVKALHECGHAYVAAYHGCRVPTVGVAFMVLIPMLYTDVTDAWRLSDRRARLGIDAAGILVEIALACLALFLWPFLPEGPAKTAAFMVATASLILTLGLNLNPFMRFDGYYLLADYWRFDNLQPRAFALGQWRLRDILFAAREPAPEALPPAKRRLVILYAWSVWIYRLVIFTGIALMVYHMFFKALGLVLFAIEIIFFIARPIVREIKQWWTRRHFLFATRRAAITAGAGILFLAFFCFPWSSRVDIPAVIEVREVVRLYPVRAARIVSVPSTEGQALAAGTPLITLEVPELASQIKLARTKLDLIQLRLSRRTVDTQDREQSLVLEDEARSLRTQLDGLAREQALLAMKSPFAGQLMELNAALHPGRWIAKGELIAIIGKPGNSVVRGYVSEIDVWRIAPGARGYFVPNETPRARIAVVLDEIAPAGAPAIDIAEVMSIHGGGVAVEEDRTRRQVPVSAQYLVTLNPAAGLQNNDRVVRGTVVLRGMAESFAVRTWRQVTNILIRETGF